MVLYPYSFSNRFSRRKILLVSFIFSALSAIGALLVSDKAEHDKGNKVYRKSVSVTSLEQLQNFNNCRNSRSTDSFTILALALHKPCLGFRVGQIEIYLQEDECLYPRITLYEFFPVRLPGRENHLVHVWR